MADTTSTLFTEILRPKSLDQAILPDRIRVQLQNEINSPQGLISNILVYGIQGSGKTTISRILASGHDTKVINCSETGIEAVRTDIQMFASQYSIDGDNSKVKVVLLEECDGFTPEAWKAMRATVEKYANSVRFIANCNYIEKVPDPIKSRFLCIQMEPQGPEEKEQVFNGYYNRVADLLGKLQIAFEPENLKSFIEMYFPDFRSILNNVQSLYIRGVRELSPSTLASSFDYQKIFDLIVNGSNPWDTYKLIRDEYSENPDGAMVAIGMKFPDYVRTVIPQAIAKLPMIVIAIAEHQDMLVRSINKKITLASLVFKIQTILHQ